MTIEELQQQIGITFQDQSLLKQAFVHRSYLNESKEFRESNERLEFLGDAVLSFCTSQFLYRTYPKFPEGILTNIRSTLVKTQSLGDVATTLHLGDMLLLSRGEESSGGRQNISLLADSFEALLGALYLDQGVEAATTFLTNVLFPKTEAIIETKSYVDYKSLLQELTQGINKLSPTYKVIKSEGPDHDKVFWVEVVVGDKAIGSGHGKSKQEAEQNAAASGLEKYPKA
ncbi:ribonuclease III [Candidatus Woesebacteria bacterium]|jgi:ribonuclease-3|nr:ribonuclease III [Candidatus Woesebacteria bacterium]